MGDVVDLFTQQTIGMLPGDPVVVQHAEEWYRLGQLPVDCPFCEGEGAAFAKPTRRGWPHVRCPRCGCWAMYPGTLGQEMLWQRAIKAVTRILQRHAEAEQAAREVAR